MKSTILALALGLLASACLDTSTTDAERAVEATECLDDECAECEPGFYVFENDPVTEPTPSPEPTPTPEPTPEPTDPPGPTPSTDEEAKAPVASSGAAITIEVSANGTVTMIENGVRTVLGVASKSGRGWVLGTRTAAAIGAAMRGGAKITWNFARCFGPLGALLMLAELSYAGVAVTLGPAAEQMGVRQKDCADRFLEHALGIACLRQQPHTSTCTDAIAACPKAIFGANLKASCSTEDAYPALLQALVDALKGTSVLKGGAGTLADKDRDIMDAIESGTFATDAETACRMRDLTKNCQMNQGAIWKDASYAEAKACWDNAPRDAFYWKWHRANDCCTTAACKAHLIPMKDC